MMIHPLIHELFPSADVRDWVISAAPKWSSFNPCIASHPEGGYRMIVRSSNYVMDDSELVYQQEDPEGAIRTINRLCVLDPELNICEMADIDDRAVRHVEWPMVRGMEDARIYYAQDGLWHVYGTLREHRRDGNCEIAEDILSGATAVRRWIHPTPYVGRVEKNHMVIGDGPEFVYLCGPSIVINGVTGATRAAPYDVAAEAYEFRGSSQAVPYGDGFIASVHEVSWTPRPRNYAHRYVRFSADGYLTHFTPPFHHLAPGIEFCAGLVVKGDRVVTSVGYKEHRVLLVSVPIAEIESQWIKAKVP